MANKQAFTQVNDENYVVIQGWMITQLNLKGNELLIYAIIYGFTRCEELHYTGSLAYLAAWTNSTKQGVVKCLKALCEKGYITKVDKVVNGVKYCEYYATEFNGGIKQSLHNNIDIYNIDNNIEDKIEIESNGTAVAALPQKRKHGEYNNVLLTDEELEKLKEEFSDYQEKIDRLSSYVASSGKAYKNHYATIRNWARKDEEKNGAACKNKFSAADTKTKIGTWL